MIMGGNLTFSKHQASSRLAFSSSDILRWLVVREMLCRIAEAVSFRHTLSHHHRLAAHMRHTNC